MPETGFRSARHFAAHDWKPAPAQQGADRRRYTHLAYGSLKAAANRIASRIAEDAGRYPVGHAGAGMAARGAPLAWSCKVKSVEASNLPTSIAFMAYCW